jgi:glucose/arabinose dehydrogenase
MTMRDKDLQAQKEYEQALKDVEEKKPEGRWFKIFASDGSQTGRIIFSPDNDTLTIEIGGSNFQIDGKYINSINQALNKLLSEIE